MVSLYLVQCERRQCATHRRLREGHACCSSSRECAYIRVHCVKCVSRKVQWRIGAILSGRSGRVGTYIRRRVSRFILSIIFYVCDHGPRAKVCGRRHVRRAWLITYKRHCKSRRYYLYAVGRETYERGRPVSCDATRMLLSERCRGCASHPPAIIYIKSTRVEYLRRKLVLRKYRVLFRFQ